MYPETNFNYDSNNENKGNRKQRRQNKSTKKSAQSSSSSCRCCSSWREATFWGGSRLTQNTGKYPFRQHPQ